MENNEEKNPLMSQYNAFVETIRKNRNLNTEEQDQKIFEKGVSILIEFFTKQQTSLEKQYPSYLDSLTGDSKEIDRQNEEISTSLAPLKRIINRLHCMLNALTQPYDLGITKKENLYQLFPGSPIVQAANHLLFFEIESRKSMLKVEETWNDPTAKPLLLQLHKLCAPYLANARDEPRQRSKAFSTPKNFGESKQRMDGLRKRTNIKPTTTHEPPKRADSTTNRPSPR